MHPIDDETLRVLLRTASHTRADTPEFAQATGDPGPRSSAGDQVFQLVDALLERLDTSQKCGNVGA